MIYPGIGIFTKAIEGKTFVYGVMAGLPGDKAGLLTGDEIVSADGKAFQPVGSFTGKTGTPVSLEIRRSADGETRRVVVVPETIEPGDAFRLSLIVRASSSAMAKRSATSVSGRTREAATKTCSRRN